jgi:hypothetical protein
VKQDTTLSEINDLKHICELCYKTFTSRQGKYQHKRHCKGTAPKVEQYRIQTENETTPLVKQVQQHKKSTEENFNHIKQQMNHIISEITHMKSQPLNHTTNNYHTTINIDQSTKTSIYSFTDVPLECIKDETMLTLLSKTYFQQLFDSLKEIVRLVYYNEKHPENHAVYIPNVRNKYAKVWNGQSWIFQNRDDILINVRNKTIELMNKFFCGNEQRFSMMQKQHLRKWHDRYYDDSDKLFDKKTKTAVEETILSYQSLVKKTIDKYNLL